MAVTLVNEEPVPVAVELVTPFGSKVLGVVQPGKKATASFNTLTGNLTEAGQFTLTATITGSDPVESLVDYGTYACG
jgi:hypothetical protein